jgi:hypothetical protein
MKQPRAAFGVTSSSGRSQRPGKAGSAQALAGERLARHGSCPLR